MKDHNLPYKNLIVKFLSNEISERELEIFKRWLEEDAENRRIFDRSNMLWQESGFKIDDPEIERAWNILSEKAGIISH